MRAPRWRPSSPTGPPDCRRCAGCACMRPPPGRACGAPGRRPGSRTSRSAFRGIQRFARGSKNTADMAIVADAVADFADGLVDHVAVVSNDSDFGVLFVKIQELANPSGPVGPAPFLWINPPRRGWALQRDRGVHSGAAALVAPGAHRPGCRKRVGFRRKRRPGTSVRRDHRAVGAGQHPCRQVQGRGRPQDRPAALPDPSRGPDHQRLRVVPGEAAGAGPQEEGDPHRPPEAEDLREGRMMAAPSSPPG